MYIREYFIDTPRENKSGVRDPTLPGLGRDPGDAADVVEKAHGAFDHPSWNDPYRAQTVFLVVVSAVTAIAAVFGTYWLPRSTDLSTFVGGLGIALPLVLVGSYVTLLVVAALD